MNVDIYSVCVILCYVMYAHTYGVVHIIHNKQILYIFLPLKSFAVILFNKTNADQKSSNNLNQNMNEEKPKTNQTKTPTTAKTL